MRFAVLAAGLGLAVSLPSYPLMMQCDPRWGGDEMGVAGDGERSTICREGCAMSCLSMVLAGLGAPVDGAAATPGSLNTWLLAHVGYVCLDGDCNNLVLDAVQRLNASVRLIGESPKPAFGDIAAGLLRGDVAYIAHVLDKSHFVLLTAAAPGAAQSFSARDPAYSTTEYSYEGISDIIMYNISAAERQPPLPPASADAAVVRGGGAVRRVRRQGRLRR